MSLTLVTPPAVRAVTESEIWTHLRVPLTGSPAEPVDKALIAGMLDAAIETVDGRDGILGRALVTQVWNLTLDAFPAHRDYVLVPLRPVQSIDAVTYVDADGVSQTWADTNYSLSADRDMRPRLNLGYGKSWPATRCQPDAVTVQFTTGYASGNSPEDGTGVPDPIRNAIKLHVQALYERDPRSYEVLMRTRTTLLAPYRAGLVA